MYFIPVKNSLSDLLKDMSNNVVNSAIVDQYLFASQQHSLESGYLIDVTFPSKVQYGALLRGNTSHIPFHECARHYVQLNKPIIMQHLYDTIQPLTASL